MQYTNDGYFLTFDDLLKYACEKVAGGIFESHQMQILDGQFGYNLRLREQCENCIML